MLFYSKMMRLHQSKFLEDVNPTHLVLSPGPGRPENAGNLISIAVHIFPKIRFWVFVWGIKHWQLFLVVVCLCEGFKTMEVRLDPTFTEWHFFRISNSYASWEISLFGG